MSTRDRGKLPKWAQELIHDNEIELEFLRQHFSEIQDPVVTLENGFKSIPLVGKNEYTQLLIGSNEEGWRVRLMDNGGLEIFAPWGARDLLVKPRASNLIELEGRRA